MADNKESDGDGVIRREELGEIANAPDMNGLIIGEPEDFETIKKEILDVFPG